MFGAGHSGPSLSPCHRDLCWPGSGGIGTEGRKPTLTRDQAARQLVESVLFLSDSATVWGVWAGSVRSQENRRQTYSGTHIEHLLCAPQTAVQREFRGWVDGPGKEIHPATHRMWNLHLPAPSVLPLKPPILWSNQNGSHSHGPVYMCVAVATHTFLLFPEAERGRAELLSPRRCSNCVSSFPVPPGLSQAFARPRIPGSELQGQNPLQVALVSVNAARLGPSVGSAFRSQNVSLQHGSAILWLFDGVS